MLLLNITRCTVIKENAEKYTNNFGVKEMKWNNHSYDKIKILMWANHIIFECEFSRLLNPL